MSRVRVKICGITREKDAKAACAAGADAIGLVFCRESPRFVSTKRARRILNCLPPFVMPVALFADTPPGEVEQVLAEVPAPVLQFHGRETPEECRRYGRPYLKALRVDAPKEEEMRASDYSDAAAILWDAWAEKALGGTGRSFDWSRVPERPKQPLVLAGGLHPGNVGAAIAALSPWAVDVSSGVESAPGIKEPALIEAFLAAAVR